MVRLVQTSAALTCTALLLFTGNMLAQSAATSTPTSGNATISGTAAKTSQHHSSKRKKNQEPEQPVAQTPPRPPTPEEMAPVAPTVSYQAGQLTIDSKNATLSQVLRSVQAKTGGSFDIPPATNNERVVAHLGPGQPKDVLATLLNGSKFNYIILGVPDEPGSVQKLILTPRQNAPVTNTAQNRPTQTSPEPQPEEDYAAPEPVTAEDNSANEGQPQQPPYRPGGFTPNQPNQNADSSGQQTTDANGQPQQGVKSPEQLLQELQRMQQQQQQYQQQLNPANQGPPPQNPQPQQP